MARSWGESNDKKTKEAIVAKDADRLDQILLQREYLQDKQYDFDLWHNNIAKDLQTNSARDIASKIKERNPLQWVYNLFKISPKDEK